MRELVGERERRDIERTVDRILRDTGHVEPPLSLPIVRDLLRLDLRFYQLDDPTFTQELAHRVRVAGRQVVERPGLLIEAVRKANLSALWLPDTKRILIDQSVPTPKHRWIEAHEVGHSVIPWHAGFMFGDNEQTLDPACHAIIEAEANYSAGRLLFLGDRFASQARDLPPTFDSVRSLKNTYQNTLTSTLWRFVEVRDPAVPMVGMVGQHPRHSSVGRGGDGTPWRYFIRSSAFLHQFAGIQPRQIYALLEKHASWKKKGPIVDASDVIVDDRGAAREFRIESFSNTYDLLTLVVCIA